MQKAPAATLEVLAQALKETYAQINPKYGETEVKTIGTRHGEKLYETLVTREEMAKAIDMGDYYRIPCDNRDLNMTSSLPKVTRRSLLLRIITATIPLDWMWGA